jgi:16S rRNA (adenine1518-N6/adenine1519-N6)-dimethyltransferase
MQHQPRKRFGQHFLIDSGVIDAIVRAIDPQPGDNLVEIGPGLGALTDPLRRCGAQLTVIELDRDLAARWRDTPGVRVVQADVLGIDFNAWAQDAGRPLRIVGNLPYNISTPILFRLLQAADRIADQHLMLQREVVMRMAAAPGNKDYGRLSVMLQWRYDIEPLLDVPPAAFDPPPRVHSTVVRMLPLPVPPVLDEPLLESLVAVAFSQRRKLLRHTLGRWLAQAGADHAFDLQRRAEEVPVEQYVALTRDLMAQGIPAVGSTLQSGA